MKIYCGDAANCIVSSQFTIHNMRRYLIPLLTLLLAFSASAQKYACVNTQQIMQQIPDYQQLLNKLDKFAAEWQQEIEDKQQEIDNLRAEYQREAYLLPDNLKQRRQDEIKNRETELRTLQRQRFGIGGDLDTKRAELVKPIQDRVYNAIERIAREKSYAFVFDKANGAPIVYVNDKFDISSQVLEALGIKPGQNDGAAPQGAGQGKSSSEPSSPGKSPAGNSAMKDRSLKK